MFLEKNEESYHSFVELVNLAKEVSDYIYNEDIINSKIFKTFKETKSGFELIFNKVEKEDIFINTVKRSIKNEKGDSVSIDKVYSEIEDLYRSIKLEFYVNIKQMDEKIKTFKGLNMINEKFIDEFESKLDEKYKSLKNGILDLLDSNLNGDITKVKQFLIDYTDPDSEEVLEGFVENADIFDTYLKYQNDIDQILEDNDYYDNPPEVKSLYDYVISGTFDAVILCMEIMKKELYGED